MNALERRRDGLKAEIDRLVKEHVAKQLAIGDVEVEVDDLFLEN